MQLELVSNYCRDKSHYWDAFCVTVLKLERMQENMDKYKKQYLNHFCITEDF